MVDGNFHADHLKMRHPEDDVALADGCAFMVETGPYEEHLRESKDVKQVCFLILPLFSDSSPKFHQKSGCNNYRAINAANINRKNKDATGIGACACARHGCFIPQTVVDFQKGERYTCIQKRLACAYKKSGLGK